MPLKIGIVTGGGYSGWVIAQDEAQKLTITARPVLDLEGRVHFTEVLVTGNFVSPATLRDVPLVPVASWVSDHRDRFTELELPLPILEGEPLDAERARALEHAEGPGRRPPMRIAGATEPHKPAGFYVKVADRYRWLVGTHDKHPAKTIAEANGVSSSVVHQWVRKCRRDGLLGATVPGRASAGVPAVFTQAIPPKSEGESPRHRRLRETRDFDDD